MSRAKTSRKPGDRFDEIKDVILDVGNELTKKISMLDRKAGALIEQVRHDVGLVAELVGHNTEKLNLHGEKLDDIQDDIKMIKYELKEKADNTEIVSLSRRVTVLEKRLVNKK